MVRPTLTVHCIVKNEEYFVDYALRSVLPFADKIMVFDTGSTDGTVSIVKDLQREIAGKIFFEEKGISDKERHTALRQEMVERTTTDWFMILDGDEIWTKRGMQEAVNGMAKGEATCLIAPFYLCVGDVYHTSVRGQYTLRGQTAHFTPRFFRYIPGMRWSGAYNEDALVDRDGAKIFEKDAVEILKNPFWHVSHLRRSANDDAEYSSGGTRARKRRLTYIGIGKKITEPVPEIFTERPTPATERLAFLKALLNVCSLAAVKFKEKFA